MSLSANISQKELHSYFNSPIAYVFITVFLIVASGLFMTPFFVAGVCDMRAFFNNLPLLLIIFIPAVTMRLWAEENRRGTLGLLFSLPCTSNSLVIGKFIAAFIFCALAIMGTITIPVMLYFLGNPDPGPIIAGYIGSLLVIAFLLSLGMAISAFFKDQIVAFILSLVAGFFFFLAGTEFFATFVDGWFSGLGTFLRHGLGLTSHFVSFAKGVIDIGDVLFFLSYTLVFLIINVLTVEGLLKLRIQKGFYAAVFMLLGIAIFFNALIFDIRLPRIDLTENKIYTLSAGTKEVLSKLKVPISVIYYCSSKEKMPTAMKEMARDVGDILDELSKLSPKFTYKIVDPDSLSEEERKEIERKGIRPFNTQTIERDALNIKRIYSAIQLSYLDKKDEIIPQILPDSLGSLEYDLVSKIFRLTLNEKPKVVLVAPKEQIPPEMLLMYQRMGQPIPPAMDNFHLLEEVLRSQGYVVVRQEITKDSPLPKDANALFILGPWQFNQRQLYEVRRFLELGKPVILAFQHYKYRYTSGAEGVSVIGEMLNNNLNELVKDLGVKVNQEMLFDKRSAVLSVESSTQMGLFTALVRTPVNFPMQIKVLPDSMNQEISITSDLAGLLYLWGNCLDLAGNNLEKNKIRTTLLFETSPFSWLRPFHPGRISPSEMVPDEAKMEKRPLAVLLQGKFKNPFAQNGIPKWPGDTESSNSTDTGQNENTNKNRKKESDAATYSEVRPSTLILIGCSEMFADSAISAFSNATFILNTIDVLCLGEELIHIRTKTQMLRPIKEVSPGERLFWKAFSTFFMPLLWIIFGIIHFIRRKNARRNCSFAW